MQIFGIRYFSVKTDNTLFDLPQGVTPKGLFPYSLSQNVIIQYYGRKYTTRYINQTEDSRYIAGYLLKSVDTHIINLDERLFEESDVENWEKLFFIIDQETQIFACQLDQNIASPENVKNVLTELIHRPLTNFGWTIKLEYIVDRFMFWSILDNSEGIFQIAFKLNAPNLFGGSKKANEWLKTLKEKHNMSSIGIDIKNEDAALTYDKEELESYRDYADSGGGSWTLKVLQNRKPKKYKSSEHLRRRELEIENDSPRFVVNNLQFVFSRMVNIFERFND